MNRNFLLTLMLIGILAACAPTANTQTAPTQPDVQIATESPSLSTATAAPTGAFLPTPLKMMQTATQAPPVPAMIQESIMDWSGIEPFLVDAEGDSVGDASLDLTAIYTYEDADYVYVMVESVGGFKDNLRSDMSTMSLDLRLDLLDKSACRQDFEIMIEITARNNYNVYYVDYCDLSQWNLEITEVQVAWGDTLEIKIPKSVFAERTWVFEAPYQYIRPVSAELDAMVDGTWTFNVDEIP